MNPREQDLSAELVGVHKTYRLGAHVVPALVGLDLKVKAGELLALTGPSGSGKSTILNLCGLIDAPDQGEVFIGGKSVRGKTVNELTMLRRDRIGFIFQGFNLVPVMTVDQNVDYPLFLMGVARADRERRVTEMLSAVGLLAHRHHKPDALSGGQRQRVAIARALVKNPTLVIADEPTASLDSATASQVLALMRDMCHTAGSAFVIATHDHRLTDRCDRIVQISDGKLS